MIQWTVEVSEQSEYDLAEAAAWYEKQGADLGIDLVARTRETIERIGKNPLIYPLVHHDLRRAGVKRFPYGVFFRARENTVQVVGIFHDHRDPLLWQSR